MFWPLFMSLLVGLEFKPIQVKSGFLLSELRYRYKPLQGIFLPQNLGLHLISQLNIDIVKVTKKYVNHLGFLGHPLIQLVRGVILQM